MLYTYIAGNDCLRMVALARTSSGMPRDRNHAERASCTKTGVVAMLKVAVMVAEQKATAVHGVLVGGMMAEEEKMAEGGMVVAGTVVVVVAGENALGSQEES